MNAIIITGGTSGLGLKLMEEFSKLDYIAISISRYVPQEIQDRFANNRNVKFLIGDVSSESFMEGLCKLLDSLGYSLKALINNASIIRSGGIEELKRDDWDSVLNTNLTGVYQTTKALLPLLAKERDSAIINISSISSARPGSSIAYCASKAAVDIMTKCMAKEFSKYHILVNSINPGIMETGFQVHNGQMNQEQYAEFISSNNVVNLSTVTDLVIYLATKNSTINGQNIIVNNDYYQAY